MGQAKLKRALGLQPARPRIKAGRARVLAMEYAVVNGAPTIKLDFEDPAMLAIDFKMTPMTALRLVDTLDQPFEDFWRTVKGADLEPSPPDRQAADCGPMGDVAVHIDRAIGIPHFKMKFLDAAPIASIEFELSPPLVVALMQGIFHSARQFNWLKALEAGNARQSKLH